MNWSARFPASRDGTRCEVLLHAREPVGVLRVNYNQRGVHVPAGEHEVRFVYRPKSVIIGAAVSLLAALGLLLWWRRLLPESRLLAPRPRKHEEQGEGVSV